MPNNCYRVTWSFDVFAESPVEAMKTARNVQLVDYPIQPLFHVQETCAGVNVFAPFDLDVSTGTLAGIDPDASARILDEDKTITLSSGLTITKAQYKALVKVYARGQSSGSFESFLQTVQSYGDYIGVAWAGMFLGIETDGYTHS